MNLDKSGCESHNSLVKFGAIQKRSENKTGSKKPQTGNKPVRHCKKKRVQGGEQKENAVLERHAHYRAACYARASAETAERREGF